jgi:hypothetical protein
MEKPNACVITTIHRCMLHTYLCGFYKVDSELVARLCKFEYDGKCHCQAAIADAESKEKNDVH